MNQYCDFKEIDMVTLFRIKVSLNLEEEKLRFLI